MHFIKSLAVNCISKRKTTDHVHDLHLVLELDQVYGSRYGSAKKKCVFQCIGFIISKTTFAKESPID